MAPDQDTTAGATVVYELLTFNDGTTWYLNRRGHIPAETVQDSLATILTDTNSIDFVYNDGANTITADLRLNGATLNIGASGVKVSDGGITVTQLADNAVTEAKLDINNSASNGYLLSYDSSDGRMKWISSSAAYTDEMAQDAVGAILSDTNSIDLTYNDGANTITADLRLDGVTLTISASGVKVSSGGITATELATNAVTTLKINDSAVTEAKLDMMNSPTADYLLAYDTSGQMKWIAQTVVYDDEKAQDAVGNILVDGNTINFTYTDATPAITAEVILDGGTLSSSATGLKVANSGITATQLASDSVTEAKLDVLNSPTDGYLLSYDSGTGRLEWIASAAGYSNEDAQDAVGGILTDTNSIDLTYNDGANTITADLRLDGSTLTISGSGTKVSTSGITATELAANAVTEAKLDINNAASDGYVLTFDNSDGRMKWVAPTVIYDDEKAQDAVGNILVDGNTINFTYTDATPAITAEVILDGGTLSSSASGLKVANAGITATQLASDSVTEAKLDINNAASDGYLLSYDNSDGRMKWISSSAAYTNEMAQDAVGAIVTGTNSIDLTYNDGANTITADLRLDGGTLSVSGSGVKVANSGITATQLASDSVTEPKLDSVTAASNKDILTYDSGTSRLKWVSAAAALPPTFIDLVWAAPGAESSDAIEIQASIQDQAGNAITSALVEVEVRVSDAANDYEPSSTAIITAAGTPVGTLLAGSGTATTVWQTNSSGLFKIKVTETAAADRYLWIRAGGNTRLFVKSLNGVQQLTFA